MNFDDTQKELLKYVSENPIWRIFLPISEVILLGGQTILLISRFGLHIGIISTILTILIYVAMVMVLAKGNYKVLLIGLLLRMVTYLITVVTSMFGKYSSFDLGSLLYALVWGYFTYLAYKKTLKKG